MGVTLPLDNAVSENKYYPDCIDHFNIYSITDPALTYRNYSGNLEVIPVIRLSEWIQTKMHSQLPRELHVEVMDAYV